MVLVHFFACRRFKLIGNYTANPVAGLDFAGFTNACQSNGLAPQSCVHSASRSIATGNLRVMDVCCGLLVI